MYLLKTPEIFDPEINLAIEEYAVRNLNITDDFLFVYRNKPSIIIGKNQNPFEEVNLSLLSQQKINLYRRISGGGTVYHDLGNINFCYLPTIMFVAAFALLMPPGCCPGSGMGRCEFTCEWAQTWGHSHGNAHSPTLCPDYMFCFGGGRLN